MTHALNKAAAARCRSLPSALSPADARAELARWQGILGCPEATGRESLAMHMATQTAITVAQAREALAAAGIAEGTQAALVARIVAAGRIGQVPT